MTGGVSIFAPAKVNLALHITGQRDDGYHLLDSLVCFPGIGDQLVFRPEDKHGDKHGLSVLGSDLPADDDNLVLQAARTFLAETPVHMTLHKALPISSGIGGGSADAAAVLRYARQKRPGCLDNDGAASRILKLGADVPVCVKSTPQRMMGIGEQVFDVPTWPDTGTLLLVNPGITVSTPAVFKALMHKANAPMPERLPPFHALDDLVQFLKTTRNDLQAPAMSIAPEIQRVIGALETLDGCQFARMSGSGATCFAIFACESLAASALERLHTEWPDWWAALGPLNCHMGAQQSALN